MPDDCSRQRWADWNRFLRAPWAFDEVPLRFRITKAAYAPVPVWVACPLMIDGEWPMAYVGDTGSRAVYLPRYSAVAATWEEALTYVTTGKRPRPLVEVYPAYCGVFSNA